jgi:cytochrome c biogenesis protein CcdA
MPVMRVPMMKTMAIGVLVTTIASFLIIVLLGPGSALPDWVRYIQVIVTIIAIVIVLALTLMAFVRITQGDLRSQHLLPAWDNALANWGRLRYCKRDNIVFDPQQPNRALSDQEVHSLLSVQGEANQPGEESTKIPQKASS